MEPTSHAQSASGRSRSGCITCRTKKVKCDEKRSTCGRCNRLRLTCEWQSGPTRKEKAKARLKARSRQPKILPNLDHIESQTVEKPPYILPTADFQTHVLLPEDASNSISDFEILGHYDQTTSSDNGWENWYQELGFPTDDLDIGNFAAQTFQSECLLDPSSNPLTDTVLELFSQPPTLQVHVPHNLLNLSSPLNILNPRLSPHNIALSPSFEMTAKEEGALYHYRSYFALSTVTKNITWSTHMVMLRHGSQTPMVMHLLMAASLMDLAAFQHYDEKTCSAARQHFRAGAYLLVETMGSGEELDHVKILIAFFFLYKYMTKQKVVDPNSITQLSKTLCDHIRKYNLDALCGARPVTLPSTSTGVSLFLALPRDKRECLARLMVWLFYEDIFSAMNGYGGTVAKHLRKDPELTSELYQCSTTILESSWGEDYPESEVLDDIENGSILKFMYDVMTMYADVTEACQLPEDKAKEVTERIETNILMLEEKSRSLFRLTTFTIQPRTRLMINADYMISYFYALRVYKYRCFLPPVSSFSTAPPFVLASMNTILSIAQRAFSAPHDESMTERFQWPLFMAGIETQDPIHREWILGKLRKERLKTAMERVCEIQKAGRRMPMPAIRQIMRGADPEVGDTEDQSLSTDGLGNIYF